MGVISKTFLDYACGKIAGYGYGNGLSNREIDAEISKFVVKYNVQIPPLHQMTAKAKKLKHAIQCFSDKQQAEIIRDFCLMPQLEEDEEIKEVLQLLTEQYGYLFDNALLNTELVQKTKHWLSSHPASLEEYESALVKYEKGVFERNTLDDMRLALELLIKDLLGNKKSLENQIGEIGKMLKNAGVSEEIRNMVTQMISYYEKFQNEHVKHNNAINGNELEYVIELTSVIMKFLIKAGGGIS